MKCTTIEQGKHLLELGLDPRTADMYWACRYDDLRKEEECYAMNRQVFSDGHYRPILSQDVPAWSAEGLMELLPSDLLLTQHPTIYNYADFNGEKDWVAEVSLSYNCYVEPAHSLIEALISIVEDMVKDGIFGMTEEEADKFLEEKREKEFYKKYCLHANRTD